MKAPNKNCEYCDGSGKVYLPETQKGDEWIGDCECTLGEEDDMSGSEDNGNR